MGWDFLKNKTVLLKWFENWTAPIITRIIISQKDLDLDFPYYHNVKYSRK